MERKNLCVVLEEKQKFSLEYRKIPEPTSNEVLIAVHSVGICGSDVHFWKDGRIGKRTVKEPIILGHEASGVIVKVGSEVKHLQKGDRVSIEPGVPCRKCEFCRNGRYNICPDVKFCAAPPVNGMLCRYYCHDADFCFKLPDNVTLEEGAIVEPLSVAVYACKRSGVSVGKSVLICGAGSIGLLTLLTCKAMGVTQICITDICCSRLEFGKSLGANCQICVKNKEMEDSAREITNYFKGFPDITIECSGAESSIKLGIKVTKPGGTFTLVGLGFTEIKLPLAEIAAKEVDIRGVFRYANCFPTALELIKSRLINVHPLITHHFRLENSREAFQISHTGAEGAIKVLIQCTE